MNTKQESEFNVHMQQNDFKPMSTVKPGSTLYCDSGILWVTQPGDLEDHVLHTGEKLTVTNRGKVLIEAMQDADFRLA